MAVPISELQSVAPSAVIELFTLELNVAQHGIAETYRFHAGTNVSGGNLVWAGNTYLAMAIEASGFEYSGNGQLPRPKIRVSNTMGTITALILSLPNGLEAAKVTRIRTLARYLDGVNWPGGVNPLGTPQPDAEFPREVFFLDRKSAETRDVVEYEMCSAFDLATVRAPKRQCIANICPWVYRSPECSYSKAAYYDINNNPVGSLALDVCNKRLDGCETRFSVFGRDGSVTVGSNVLTMASTTSILPGDSIRGWGLPTGTTVSSVTSSTALVLSAAATASSSATATGTLSTTDATLVVTDTTGLAVGMAVAGTYVNNSTIAGISGTTLTISQRPYQLVKSATAFYA
jgi:lambda family phage minor tail protein L